MITNPSHVRFKTLVSRTGQCNIGITSVLVVKSACKTYTGLLLVTLVVVVSNQHLPLTAVSD